MAIFPAAPGEAWPHEYNTRSNDDPWRSCQHRASRSLIVRFVVLCSKPYVFIQKVTQQGKERIPNKETYTHIFIYTCIHLFVSCISFAFLLFSVSFLLLSVATLVVVGCFCWFSIVSEAFLVLLCCFCAAFPLFFCCFLLLCCCFLMVHGDPASSAWRSLAPRV